MKKNSLPLLALLSFFVFLEGAARLVPSLKLILPPPSSVFAALWRRSPLFLSHTFHTFLEMAYSLTTAILLAFPLAWGIFSSPTLKKILYPFFILTQCIPMFTLAPIMILWFGWTMTSILCPTILMIFLPLTFTIFQGFEAAPIQLVELFRLNQATPWQMFTKLYLPCSLPYILAGLRIATTVVGMCTIAAEWGGGQKGLGVLMLESRFTMDLEACFGALFCLALLTFSLFSICSLLERIYLKDHLYEKISR